MLKNYIEYIFEFLPMAWSLKDEILKCGEFNKAIEIGCSIGGNTRHIAKISRETTGIDLDEDRISMARGRFKNINFKLKDATQTGYEDKSFDVAFLILVLHEAPERNIIKEACRISKKVVVIDYNHPVSGLWAPFFRFIERDKIEIFDNMNIEQIFEEYGFDVEKKNVFNTNFRKWIFAEY